MIPKQRGGWLRALLNGLAVLVRLCLLGTALPVHMLRWFQPTTSALMVEARLAAWRAGVRGYHTEFRWASLEEISPQAAIAVIVDADGAGFPICNEEYRSMCATLTAELSRHDIVLWAVHVVDRVAAGGRWHCVDGCGAGGVVDDPCASPLAVAAVLDGRRLYARRADDDRAHSASLIDLIAENAASRDEARRAEPMARVRRDVEDAMAAAARVGDGQQLSDAELAKSGTVFTGMQPVSAEDLVKSILLGHIDAHFGSIRKTIGG